MVSVHGLTGLKKFTEAPRLLSYDSYDLPDAESEREIERIFFFIHFDLICRMVFGDTSSTYVFLHL